MNITDGQDCLSPLFCSMKTFDSSVKAMRRVSTHLTEEPQNCVILKTLSYIVFYHQKIISTR